MPIVEWPHQSMSGPSLIGIFRCSVQFCQGRRLISSMICNFVRLVFHYLQGWLLWVRIQKSLTVLKIFGYSRCLRELRLSRSLRGGSCCQESCQKSVLLPFLTSQKACLWIRGRFSQTVFHILDPCICSLNLINWSGYVFGAYFCFQIFFHSSFGCCNHLHHILVPMIWLSFPESKIPNPPNFLGL